MTIGTKDIFRLCDTATPLLVETCMFRGSISKKAFLKLKKKTKISKFFFKKNHKDCYFKWSKNVLSFVFITSVFTLFSLKGRERLNMMKANICSLSPVFWVELLVTFLQDKECIVPDDLHLDCDPSPWLTACISFPSFRSLADSPQVNWDIDLSVPVVAHVVLEQ